MSLLLAAGSGTANTTVAGSLGTAVATGYTATIGANRTVAGAVGDAVASGFSAGVNANRTVAGALGVAAAVGFTATVRADRVVSGAVGAANASGFTAAINAARQVAGSTGTATASGFTATIGANRAVAGVLGVASASGFTGGVSNGGSVDVKVSWLQLDTSATPVDVRVSWLQLDTAATPVDVRVSWLEFDSAGQVAQAVATGGGGWLPSFRRRTRKQLHAERVRLGILPPDIVRAATKAAAVVLDSEKPYRADSETVNKVFLRELGATKMLPDYRRAIQIQIELMHQEEEEILMLL